MVMSKNGTSGKLAGWATVALAAAALAFGAVHEVTVANDKLDRNCRILAGIQANTRFLILQHEEQQEGEAVPAHGPSVAGEFKAIFKNSAIEACG